MIAFGVIYRRRAACAQQYRNRLRSCCGRVVRLLALSLDHHFLSSPNHAVTVAVMETYREVFPPDVLIGSMGVQYSV